MGPGVTGSEDGLRNGSGRPASCTRSTRQGSPSPPPLRLRPVRGTCTRPSPDAPVAAASRPSVPSRHSSSSSRSSTGWRNRSSLGAGAILSVELRHDRPAARQATGSQPCRTRPSQRIAACSPYLPTELGRVWIKINRRSVSAARHASRQCRDIGANRARSIATIGRPRARTESTGNAFRSQRQRAELVERAIEPAGRKELEILAGRGERRQRRFECFFAEVGRHAEIGPQVQVGRQKVAVDQNRPRRSRARRRAVQDALEQRRQQRVGVSRCHHGEHRPRLCDQRRARPVQAWQPEGDRPTDVLTSPSSSWTQGKASITNSRWLVIWAWYLVTPDASLHTDTKSDRAKRTAAA